MLAALAAAIVYIALTVAEREREHELNREWKECESTDWNEYYASI